MTIESIGCKQKQQQQKNCDHNLSNLTIIIDMLDVSQVKMGGGTKWGVDG